MRRSSPRSLYSLLLELYPPVFRRRFGSEILDAYDERRSVGCSETKLLFDLLRSVVRQWAFSIHVAERKVPGSSPYAVGSLLMGTYLAIDTGAPAKRHLLQSSLLIGVLALAMSSLEGHELAAPPIGTITHIDLRQHPRGQAADKSVRVVE